MPPRRYERPSPDGEPPQDLIGADDAPEGAGRPSRSARKRHALRLQKLGVRLTRLQPARLEALGLPEELLEAVLEARRLNSRAALARQHQYIGKLMRQIDADPIERILDATL